MNQPIKVNWEVEVWALRDMSATACESHRIAAEALWNGIAAASDKKDGASEQKVLTAKLAAETVGALEDFGALAWAVANRSGTGILRGYVSYPTSGVREFYKDVEGDEPVTDLLSLPNDETLAATLNADELQVFTRGLAGIEKSLAAASRNYRSLNGDLVRTYNKIKHGFVVVQRLDKLAPGEAPPTNWKQHVNVITDVEPSGSIHYTDLERSLGMLENLMGVIKTCAAAWKELAALVIWLHEHKVPLDAQ